MNPSAKEFIPNHTETSSLSFEQLSHKQTIILQQLISEWSTAPTLNTLLNQWEEKHKRITNMIKIKSDLKILLLNVSSLKLHLPDIFLLLENTPCSIVAFNGTHHNDDAVKNFSKHYSNYNVFSERGTNNFGGVLLAVHRSIPVQRVDIFQNLPNVIVLDVGASSDKFQLATCYSPPNENLPTSLFDKILKRNPNTILMGDFNAKHQSWSDTTENQKGRTLFNWLSMTSLEVINRFVATSTRSNATIDIILAPPDMSASLSSSFTVLPSIGSDHLPIVWTPAIKLQKTDRHYPIKQTYWLLVKLFLAFTFSFWNDLLTTTNDPTVSFSTYERFLALLVSRVTTVTYRNSYKPSLPPHIVDLIQQKKIALRLARKTKHPFFITQLKVYSTTIRKEIFAYKRASWGIYCDTLNKGNVKQFWKKARKHFSTTNPPINGFLLPNKTVISSPKEMCDLARSFYEDQFSQHAATGTEIETEAENIVKQLSIDINKSALEVPDIKTKDITKAISLLKNKSSYGVDGVSNKIIKLLPPAHHSFICSSFNYFMSHLAFPTHWKTAKIILLSKTKTSIVSVNDTRPISLLPCFSKLLEKIFLSHFNQWVNDHGFLPDEQTGFRPGHNMAVRLVSIIDQIGQSLSVNTAAAGLFIDFKSAFNQLWFHGLMLKLHKLDCPNYLMAWLWSYLSNRSAYIDMCGSISSTFALHKGVPQGSCVGPVIFIVYHYDILNSISLLHWKHLFADDLSILISASANWSSKTLIPKLIEQIKDVIKALISYSKTWKQPINFEKTNWIIFHRQVAPKIPPYIECDGQSIFHCEKTKYLGTLIDNKLSFSSHLKLIESKIRKNSSIFKCLTSSRMLSEAVAYRLFNAYIRPYYQSLLNIYPILSKSKQSHLEAVNRQIFRTIHGWYDATNIEISHLPKYKSIDYLTQMHWTKIVRSIMKSNPSVLCDFLQHKMYLLYITEYYNNPSLLKEKREIVNKGRTSKRIQNLFHVEKFSLFDFALCF